MDKTLSDAIYNALKETYLQVANMYDVKKLESDADKVCCTASEFRKIAQEKIDVVLKNADAAKKKINVRFTYIIMTTDDMKNAGYEGDLYDFTCQKLNEHIAERFPEAKNVISIETQTWKTKMKPRLDNSLTWYDRVSMKLSVWLDCSEWENKKSW